MVGGGSQPLLAGVHQEIFDLGFGRNGMMVDIAIIQSVLSLS